MSFTGNIPNTGQSLGFTQSLIRNNFTNYNNVISQDHVAPNSTGQGKHANIHMPVQASTPSTIANEGCEYTKTVGAQSIPFYVKDTGTSVLYPMLPIRAMCSFETTAVDGAITPLGSHNTLNIASIVNNSSDYTITFTEPLSDGFYLPLVISGSSNSSSTIISKATSNFVVNIARPLITYYVVVLHYLSQ